MAEYILFLGFVLILIAFYLWAFWQGFSRPQKLPDFTDIEEAVIRRQMLALLGLPIFILFLVLSPLAWDHWSPNIVFIALIIGFGPLAYISVISIRYRVSILRGREQLPIKGAKAVWSGVLNLVFIFLVFIGFVLYFASLP